MRFAAILDEPALQARQGITVTPGKVARREAARTGAFGDAPALFAPEVTTGASFVFRGAHCILPSRRVPDAPPLPLTVFQLSTSFWGGCQERCNVIEINDLRSVSRLSRPAVV